MKALISKHIYELVGDTEIKDKIITVFNKRAVML
jgi:hypothetical protein